MSMLEDYKAYKQFAPQYKDWKYSRDLAEAKRLEYIRRHPEMVNQSEIQKGKALLRAIDVMDEYSQRRAEDMEVATETVVSMGTGIAGSIGGAIGLLAVAAKKGFKYMTTQSSDFKSGGPLLVASYVGMGILGSIAGIPLFSWASKKEIEASRRGRFEAMRNELQNPNNFAILTKEQDEELKSKIQNLPKPRKKIKERLGLSKSIDAVKALTEISPEYYAQKRQFEKKLKKDEAMFSTELSESEIEKAKQDQQILTKLIEKIDIASQDYAENTELATTALTSIIFGASALLSLGYDKLAAKLKLGNSLAPKIIGFLVSLSALIFGASIQKEASRVGRFKVKQELLKHPEKLIYVSDEQIKDIEDIEVVQEKKPNMFKFLKEAWKNNREYKNWKRTEGATEAATIKALSELNITDEQMKDAKRLQHNTFKTFNHIDSNSQKYSESIEALGQSVQFPITTLFSTVGALAGLKYLNKGLEMLNGKTKNLQGGYSNMIKYFTIVLASVLPSIAINAYITKAQKKASRVADMLAINELKDYRHFADYSDKEPSKPAQN